MSLVKNSKYDVIKVTVSVIPRTDRFNKKEKPANIAFYKKFAKKRRSVSSFTTPLIHLLHCSSRGLQLNDKGLAGLAKKFRFF